MINREIETISAKSEYIDFVSELYKACIIFDNIVKKSPQQETVSRIIVEDSRICLTNLETCNEEIIETLIYTDMNNYIIYVGWIHRIRRTFNYIVKLAGMDHCCEIFGLQNGVTNDCCFPKVLQHKLCLTKKSDDDSDRHFTVKFDFDMQLSDDRAEEAIRDSPDEDCAVCLSRTIFDETRTTLAKFKSCRHIICLACILKMSSNVNQL